VQVNRIMMVYMEKLRDSCNLFPKSAFLHVLVAAGYEGFIRNELLCARYRRKARILDMSFEDRFHAYYERRSTNLGRFTYMYMFIRG
jgi:hypothetical protein